MGLRHYIIAGAIIGFSLIVAFGPFRHRIPRIFRLGAKYSVALKLMIFAVFAGVFAVEAMKDEVDNSVPPIVYSVIAGVLTVVAAYIATRKGPGLRARPSGPSTGAPEGRP